MNKQLLLFIYLAVFLSAAPVVIDRIVAIVEDQPILQSELNTYTNMVLMERQRLGTLDLDVQDQEAVKAFQEGVLTLMINEEILLAQARAESLTLDSDRIKKQLQAQIENITLQAGSKISLERALLQEGLTYSKFKQNMKKQLENQFLKTMLRDKIKLKVHLTKNEVEQFFSTYQESLPIQPNSVKLSHIMIKIKPHKDRELLAKEKIQAVLEKARAGEDFAALAKKFSEGPTAENGGDLGFFKKGDMVLPFERAAFSLNVGEVSDLVKTVFGWHIIKLEERKGNQILVRHILLKVEPSVEDEAQVVAQLQTIFAEIQNGLDFGEAAQKYSEDERSKDKQGEMGWLAEKDITPEIKAGIDSIGSNGLSKPTKVKGAYHLFKVVAREAERKLSLAEDWELISNAATNEEIRKRLEKKMKVWREKFFVDIRL